MDYSWPIWTPEIFLPAPFDFLFLTSSPVSFLTHMDQYSVQYSKCMQSFIFSHLWSFLFSGVLPMNSSYFAILACPLYFFSSTRLWGSFWVFLYSSQKPVNFLQELSLHMCRAHLICFPSFCGLAWVFHIYSLHFKQF